MREVKIFCDSCKKQFESADELIGISVCTYHNRYPKKADRYGIECKAEWCKDCCSKYRILGEKIPIEIKSQQTVSQQLEELLLELIREEIQIHANV